MAFAGGSAVTGVRGAAGAEVKAGGAAAGAFADAPPPTELALGSAFERPTGGEGALGRAADCSVGNVPRDGDGTTVGLAFA